ncbi:MAG: hypothetical protein ACI4JQ_04470, partial [Ruminococcus sp.]
IAKDAEGNTVSCTVTIKDHAYSADGFCTDCGAYQPTVPNTDGVYEISNAGQLYWFADKVNNDNVNYGSANAVLINHITVPSGNEWTSIGNYNNKFNGTFDGQNHTISGLYFDDESKDYVGLFGYSMGTVKNVGVVDSNFNGNDRVGGICGQNNGTITNCYYTGTFKDNGSFGGICGCNTGSIANCFSTDGTGVICKLNEGGTITKCYSLADKEDENGGRTAEQFASGEVAYLLSQGCTVGEGESAVVYDGSVWGQTIGTEDYPVLGGKKVLANVDQSAFANDMIVYGQSASLDGTIGFNIYVSADDAYDWTASFNDTVVEKSEKDANGLYKFTYQVAAKDMDENIHFTVNDKIDITVSVSDYLADLSETDNEFLKSLAGSMSDYGEAAKAFFSGGTVAEQTITDDLSVYDFAVGTMPEGISYYGSSLILESETTIRHYFKLDDGYSIGDYAFTVDSMTLTPTEKQGYYYIDIKNVSAEKLGTLFSVSVNGEEVITNYAALSYANKVLGSDSADANLKNLVKALYLYNRAAVEYNVKTGWVQDGGNWYYYDDNGIMQTGWVTNIPGYDDAWFYFNDDGIMQTGWVTNISGFDDARFYFNDYGIMQTGWVQDGENWFYFNDDGTMKTGWVKDGENWYYLNDDGTLLRNAYTPEGYYVDKNGIWTGM